MGDRFLKNLALLCFSGTEEAPPAYTDVEQDVRQHVVQAEPKDSNISRRLGEWKLDSVYWKVQRLELLLLHFNIRY
jgi:hypothetical protein